MITSIPLLTEEYCLQTYNLVGSLREIWIQRGRAAPFFSLGAATYLDVSYPDKAGPTYYDKVRRYNPILQEHFGWLYDSVRAALEEYLKAPTCYKEDFALPGFHIWLSGALSTRPVASIHFDLQYWSHNWSESDAPDFTRIISFTLPIRLPKNGGGLNIWDVTHGEFVEAYNRGLVSSAEELQHVKKKTLYPYKVGDLVVHSGDMLHQVAPVAEQVYNSDERITLQGHGVCCAGEWKLYW